MIGAIEVLLGLRSPAEMLRPGVDEGRVSGVFEVKDADVLRRHAAMHPAEDLDERTVQLADACTAGLWLLAQGDTPAAVQLAQRLGMRR